MASLQHLTSCALFGALLLLRWLGRSLGAAQVTTESRVDLGVSSPVEQQVLLREADVSRDQDVVLGSRHLLQSQPVLCYRGQTQCPSGIAECYDQQTKSCDGTNDCSDGSDEAPGFCSTYACPYYQAKCPSNKCTFSIVNHPRSYARQFLCDGIQDCLDNSDEDPAFCASFDCVAAGSLTCPGPTKQCIPLRSANNTIPPPYSSSSGDPSPLCDGIIDCKGGSDEDPTFCAAYTCASNAFKCRNNQCIARYKVCNGVIDCPDGGSDEDRGLCGPGYDCSLAGPSFSQEVHCPSGYGCYSGNTSNCNGKFDCIDQSDEDPNLCNAGACRAGYTRCPSGSGCFSGALCDGFFDCADKSDESADVCANFTCFRKCPSGQGGCIQEYQLCNGAVNCLDGSDEEVTFCRTYNCSTNGRSQCPSGVGCIDTFSLCNGNPGPPGCNNEDPAFCAGKPCGSNVRCRDGTCRPGLLCDGRTDCLDGSDEDPSYCQANQCPALSSKCADNTQCFLTTSQCDGKFDCTDKSDEDPTRCNNYVCNAVNGQVKCPGGSGQCVQSAKLCDGVNDCTNGSDEDPSYCASYQCDPGLFKCPGTNVCVYGRLCNGIRDCPDNSDESDAVCRPGVSTSSPTPTPASITGAPAPVDTVPSSTPQATTEGPSPTTCDPNSATPNLCFNTAGTASHCCPGQCADCGPIQAPSPTSGPCDPTSSLPYRCFNADGSQSVCCPGECIQDPGPTARCA